MGDDDAGDYAALMRRAWEDEVATESYYRALAQRFEGHARLALELLAQVERATADLLAPVLERLGLEPATEPDLARRGRQEAAADAGLTWSEFVTHVVDTYPAYVAEFEAIEARAPESDREAARRLTAHEVAVLDFARSEQAGGADSRRPLEEYLAAVRGDRPDS